MSRNILYTQKNYNNFSKFVCVTILAKNWLIKEKILTFSSEYSFNFPFTAETRSPATEVKIRVRLQNGFPSPTTSWPHQLQRHCVPGHPTGVGTRHPLTYPAPDTWLGSPASGCPATISAVQDRAGQPYGRLRLRNLRSWSIWSGWVSARELLYNCDWLKGR